MPPLGRQQRQRISAWRECLYDQLTTPLEEVSFAGFITQERLTLQQAAQQPRQPFPVGTKWGGGWEYAWFFATLRLPAACAGRRVVFTSGLGGEQLVYANGQAIGAIDREHPYVTLTRHAQGGEAFSLVIESYAGHGARLENLPPCPPERPAVPPIPPTQCQVQPSAAALWNEEAYQLLLDVETLDRLLSVLPEKSLRAQRVAKALMDFTRIADPELPPLQRRESYLRARQALAPVLACHNGSTAPLMWLLGQSHIDLAWLWTREETYHKSARTYANQLTLMEEYPEYRFLLCEPALLDMLREQSPALWERTLAACRRGQILPEGAFYVECDTNLPSGESLIRQLLWGKQWYREHVGVDSQVAWQPDTFGFTAALPQILQGFGVKYFATQKLLRADPECARFPYQNFLWEGLDGSTVLALSFFKNNAPVDPIAFHQRWEKDRTQQEDIDTLLFPFGYGDGGGGATRDMLEMARRLEDLEGVPRSRYGGLQDFFARMEAAPPTNRWMGELYLSWHRGAYTAQRRTKALLRRVEQALSQAEALAALTGEAPTLCPRIREAWRTLLLCQFHDVAGGVGIARVHQEAEAELTAALTDVEALIQRLLTTYIPPQSDQEGYTLYNPLPWMRREWVEAPDHSPTYVELPPLGAALLLPRLPQPDDARGEAQGDTFLLENSFLSLTVDSQGRIIRLMDKENGLPLLEPGQVMNDWRLYQNVQTVYDAWEMDRDWAQGRIPDPFDCSAALTCATPALCEVTVTRRFGASEATQRIRLFAASRRVDFVTQVHWQEQRKLLKVHFASNLLTEDALHEIQFGYVRRPTHRSHPFAADRYEVCNHRYSALCEDARGFAVLNDGIYGVSTDRGEIALSLLRAPLVPDDTCDRGDHAFTYALYPFATAFAQSGVPQAGYALNVPPRLLPYAGASYTGPWVESDTILLETLKEAEDGQGCILRLYQSQAQRSTAILHLPWRAQLLDCSMSEEILGTPLGEGDTFSLTLKPFEIRTLRLLPRLPVQGEKNVVK